DEFGVVIIHREGAGDDHLARQIACLIQHVLDSRPVHGEQHRIRFLRGLSRCAGPRLALGLPGEPLELLLAVGVAEYHLMPDSRKDGSELAAHQPGTQNANSHDSTRNRISFTSASAGWLMVNVIARANDLTMIEWCGS